ncbi:MAG: glutamate racemase [Spirochaetes bacterium]|nr:glutamate racemase [Spirochaetota bacterium]
MDDRPIGIFDSGVGGLSVCKAIKDAMPDEHIIYFGDTNRFPYGTKAIETVIRYSKEITAYLISKNVKMIVVACNTASAAALDILQKENSIPVIGVIGAGARAACRKTSGNKIGVIATRATVASESYIKAIKEILPDAEVIQQQASVFVSLVEEGWTDDDIVRFAVKKYINNMYAIGVRTLILGCTHFPLLKKAINDVFPELSLIDTGEEIALEVKKILIKKNIENSGTKGKITLYASDITDTIERLKDMFFGSDSNKINKLIIDGDK